MIAKELMQGLSIEAQMRVYWTSVAAFQMRYRFVTADHLAYSLLQSDEVIAILKSHRVEVEKARANLETWLTQNTLRFPKKEKVIPHPMMSFTRIIDRAKANLKSLGLERKISSTDLLVATFDEDYSIAIRFLKDAGFTQEGMRDVRGDVPPKQVFMDIKKE